MWSDNLIEMFDLKNKALEALIEDKIITREAENIGLDITEKEIREYYEENKQAFASKGSVHTRHILRTVAADAKRLVPGHGFGLYCENSQKVQ
jgi:parvulin-like peptidyl-prolyl isomerase